MVVLALDIGSSSVRAGVAGADLPSLVEPACAGLEHGNLSFPLKFNERRKDCVPRNALSFSGGAWQIDKDSLEIVTDSALFNGNKHRHTSPIVFSLPVGASEEISRSFLEILFEYCEAPAVFAMRSASLSAFAFGRTSALVADLGAAAFAISRVEDGQVTDYRLGGFAGDWLDSAILKRSETEIPSYYPRGSVEPLFWQRSVQLVIQDLKHSVCRVALTPLQPPPERMRAAKKAVGGLSYRLPDNTEIDICKNLNLEI